MACPSNGKCPYSTKTLPIGDENANLKEYYVTEFCLGKFESCARFIVTNSIGENNKPKDLRPDQNDVAAYLIKNLSPSWI